MPHLKTVCRSLGLPLSGARRELFERIQQYFADEAVPQSLSPEPQQSASLTEPAAPPLPASPSPPPSPLLSPPTPSPPSSPSVTQSQSQSQPNSNDPDAQAPPAATDWLQTYLDNVRNCGTEPVLGRVTGTGAAAISVIREHLNSSFLNPEGADRTHSLSWSETGIEDAQQLIDEVIACVAMNAKRVMVVKQAPRTAAKRGWSSVLYCDQQGRVVEPNGESKRRRLSKAAGCTMNITIYGDGLELKHAYHSEQCNFCDFMIEHVDPTLRTRAVTVLCDEDLRFINAVQQAWHGVVVSVCGWHKAQNFIKPRSSKASKTQTANCDSEARDGTSQEEDSDVALAQ